MSSNLVISFQSVTGAKAFTYWGSCFLILSLYIAIAYRLFHFSGTGNYPIECSDGAGHSETIFLTRLCLEAGRVKGPNSSWPALPEEKMTDTVSPSSLRLHYEEKLASLDMPAWDKKILLSKILNFQLTQEDD